ncbi:hypothetical protein BLNAU_21876 [Blattamonas nauphoetae]|nr:hypothetical protein BLNAU_21876 [Blattamonas nauphoetae]
MMSAENEPWTSALGEYSGRRGAEMEEREEDVDGVVDNDSADSRVSIQQTLHETVDTDPDLLSLFPVRLLDSSTKSGRRIDTVVMTVTLTCHQLSA